VNWNQSGGNASVFERPTIEVAHVGEAEMPPSAPKKPCGHTGHIWCDNHEDTIACERGAALLEQEYRLGHVFDDINESHDVEHTASQGLMGKGSTQDRCPPA
jgi:hypothetical protein